MRLILLVRSLHMGGAERQAVELARAMSAKSNDVRILTFYPGGELLGEAQSLGLNVTDIGRRGWWDFIFFLVRLKREIRNQKPDVLYSFTEIPNLAAVLVRPFISPCKVAWGIRNNMTFNSPAWFVTLMTLILSRLSAFTDIIIANSYAGRHEALRQGFKKANFHVVGNCINTQRFVPSESQRKEFRAQIGIADDDILIGNIGIREGKGTADFLRAAASISKKRRNLRLLIAGEDAARSTYLSELIDGLGLRSKITCIDTTTDIVSVYNAIDLLCSASHGEGFPNVIAEAMACGKPCVVTDVGESAAIVGPHGVIVPPREPVLMAEGLEKAISDLGCFGDQEAISSRISQKFSTEAVAKRTADLLGTLARS